jgi:hypothetical protein
VLLPGARGRRRHARANLRHHLARHAAQRDWLIDLTARVADDDPAPLSEVAQVNVHIESFLSTFREFA